ncbi:hypothetical protein DP73_11260 [Desulfosporosinus sp. HMP52]|uniref:hypothetical protein n=1 Tax=Desulfosporosinus sp. HMP52 TaxID=1487923 RepID=UPI00051FB77A|nr:hypothetical protein [Desulfosporosinus sp. HMP52]KGK89135.1 hypothetical protein DP73_11260 [Desulfosporosinus sp. HMP52]
MMGISGMSGSSSMPRNCGMKGMHENSQINKVPKIDELAAEQQPKLSSELIKVSEGNIIDIRV